MHTANHPTCYVSWPGSSNPPTPLQPFAVRVSWPTSLSAGLEPSGGPRYIDNSPFPQPDFLV